MGNFGSRGGQDAGKEAGEEGDEEGLWGSRGGRWRRDEWRVVDLRLTSSEEADFVNFLKILTDGYTKPNPPFGGD
jgi:hypothetical protein